MRIARGEGSVCVGGGTSRAQTVLASRDDGAWAIRIARGEGSVCVGGGASRAQTVLAISPVARLRRLRGSRALARSALRARLLRWRGCWLLALRNSRERYPHPRCGW